MMSDNSFDLTALPKVELVVRGDVFRASGGRPFIWEIYAEAETDTSARTRVKLRGSTVADITVHAVHKSRLPNEVQEVSAALLWSAIRAIAITVNKEKIMSEESKWVVKTLTLTVGLPRSGKSTWAREQGCPIVNPDAVRLALYDEAFVPSAEKMVWAICHYMVRALFLAGHARVILDATNVTKVRRDAWRGEWRRDYKHFPDNLEVCSSRVSPDNPGLLAAMLRMSEAYEPVSQEEIDD